MKPADYLVELAKLRTEIDEVDLNLLYWLERRLEIADQIGQLKAEVRTTQMSAARQTEILARLKEATAGLEPAEIDAMWRVLFDLSITRQQNKIAGCG
jgi:chorismate mutase/prephenate dehydratase